MMRRREMLSDEDEREKLEKEAELFEEATREMLNKHARKIELCARSKRWWSEEIAQKRRKLGRIKRLWRQGRAQRGEVKERKTSMAESNKRGKEKMLGGLFR
jgi:ketol-acid reductoisomerase